MLNRRVREGGRPRRRLAVVIALVLAVAAALPVGAYAALQTNFDWYRNHESDTSFTISTSGQMKALAQLVNGTADYDGDGKVDSPVDFAGKQVLLNRYAFFGNEPIEPIGTAEHPFRGSFDGQGNQVDGFVLEVPATGKGAVSNIGVFGYVDAGGSISNVGVGGLSSISISRGASSDGYITNVGMLVGYCAGSIRNCSNAGSLTITSEAAQRSAADYIPVRNIGGVAGQCVFDVEGCSNSGTISVTQTASPDSEIRHGQLVARVGGVVGLAGDETRIGTFDKHIYGEAGRHGSVRACTNTGRVSIDTPKIGQLDRFGEQTNAESVAIGGVVGYSQGSVSDCVNGRDKEPLLGVDRNVGYIRAANGVMVGGVCGSLRGVHADNMNIAWADDGADGKDPLVMSGCTNYGDVYGRVTVGGVVGKASSYTTITENLNLCKSDAFGNQVKSFVIATRWNKPSPGGVVGTANGEVSYCANFATVASAIWRDEDSRTLATQNGYYAAGIAGVLTYFDDRAPSNGGVTTPVPELFGCYNAGDVLAGANMRQRGIVGENNGYVRENVLLYGKVDDDKIAYGDSPGDKEASGIVGENRVYKADELRGQKAAEAVAFLNSNSEANGWKSYWVVSKDTGANAQNSGFPLLDRQSPWDDAQLVTDAELALVEDATYTGGESTPTLKVTLKGAELVANADYRVVPQPGAIEPSTGGKYQATIVGLGKYQGESGNSAAYDIVAGDMSKCTMTVVAHTFDYSDQTPKPEDVTVRTPAGTTVDPEQYTFAILDSDDQVVKPVDAQAYRIVVSAAEGSAYFKGTLEGEFKVKPASFMREVKLDGAKIGYLGVECPWVDSTKQGESDNPSTVLPYTGVPVLPTVLNLTYKDHELVEGVDYKVVYGNANTDEGNSGSQAENNLGKKGGSAVGCITIRYITGGKCNYSSYANMFFKIVDDGSKADLSKATFKVPATVLADGRPIEPVELYLGSQRLVEGVDYTISYEDNVEPGTASFAATGIGLFKGTLEGSFEIESGSVLDIQYSYSEEGGVHEATVVGAVYAGTRDAFDLAIPGTVEHEGTGYTVVAIADKAFGGNMQSDFQGSDANETKQKVASVSIPASVRSIGAYAFGTNSFNISAMPLASIEFAEGSRLQSIGDYAFAKCGGLQSLVVPAGVSSIGKQAFSGCTGLFELRFLTEEPGMPASIAEGAVNGAFRYCSGVNVYGFTTADAVKAFAQANAGKGGTHAGSSFTYTQMGSIRDAEISDIASVEYTGKAEEPAVSVTLNGRKLVKGVDYRVSYRDNVDAGTACVVVQGMGLLGGSVSKEFSIALAPLKKVEFSEIGDVSLGGEASFAPTLRYQERDLVEGVDYTLAYADAAGGELDAPPTEPGSYRLVATGMGNFDGQRYRVFRIMEPSIADAVVDNVGEQMYTGAAVEPNPNVRFGGVYLQRDVDYVLEYANNVEVGQAELTVRGLGVYRGSQSVAFRITQPSIADAAIAGVADVEATGDAVAFEPVVAFEGRQLEQDVDFTVSYEAAEGQDALAEDAVPSEPGSYKLVVKGIGSYRGTASAAFSIVDGELPVRQGLEGAQVSLAESACVYNGGFQKPAAAVLLDSEELVEGEDYLVTYAGNVGPTAEGQPAVATIWGIGAYSGSQAIEFSISAVEIQAADVAEIEGASYQGGDAVEPALVIQVDSRSLVRGTDYAVSFEDNVLPGQARATITGLGGYSGEVVKSFTIEKADVARAEVQLSNPVYSGTAQEPVPTVSLDGRALTAGDDYTVSYDANVDAGEAHAVIAGTGNYRGTLVAPFTITPQPLDAARVIVDSATYDGTPKEPGVSVRVGSRVLDSSDYQVEYVANVNAGQGTATVRGVGNYGGQVSAAFTINPANLAGATIMLASASVPYAAGGAKAAVKAVSVAGASLVQGDDFTVSYEGNTAVGSQAKVVISGKGNYTGSASKGFSVVKAGNPLAVKAKAVKAKTKKNTAVKAKKAFTVSGAQGKVTYKKANKAGKAKIKIARNGKITVKKGLKKGLYKVKVKVTAVGNANYKAATKTITLKVRVK